MVTFNRGRKKLTVDQVIEKVKSKTLNRNEMLVFYYSSIFRSILNNQNEIQPYNKDIAFESLGYTSQEKAIFFLCAMKYLGNQIASYSRTKFPPLAMKFPSWSPYNYVFGNPIMLVDPDGKAPEPPGRDGFFRKILDKIIIEDPVVEELGSNREFDIQMPQAGPTNTTSRIGNIPGNTLLVIDYDMLSVPDRLDIYNSNNMSRLGGTNGAVTGKDQLRIPINQATRTILQMTRDGDSEISRFKVSATAGNMVIYQRYDKHIKIGRLKIRVSRKIIRKTVDERLATMTIKGTLPSQGSDLENEYYNKGHARKAQREREKAGREARKSLR